eukprot:SAG11_NODE_1285_length_5300_cov_1.629494_9_plen_50_part_01
MFLTGNRLNGTSNSCRCKICEVIFSIIGGLLSKFRWGGKLFQYLVLGSLL